jgi:hypothetical protein
MASKKIDIDQALVDNVLSSMGFTFPRTENELDSFDNLYSNSTYELQNYSINPGDLINKCHSSLEATVSVSRKKDTNTYFKRVVLAAELVSKLHSEPTFGSVKFQKLMFLCENIEGMNINYIYSKQVAGPYDNKLMHTIGNDLSRLKWFEVKKEVFGSRSRYIFVPLEKAGGHNQYFDRYFDNFRDKIEWFITTFRKEKTDKVELIATLYACWLELINESLPVTDTNLMKRLYAWSEAKQKYSSDDVITGIEWMKNNSVVPLRSIL